jgi:hypothetical protein
MLYDEYKQSVARAISHCTPYAQTVREYLERLRQSALYLYEHDGAEADDIVAAVVQRAPRELRVIGVDKDYAQLPKAYTYDAMLLPTRYSPHRQRLEGVGFRFGCFPKSVQAHICRTTFAAALAVFGDTSDHVPPLHTRYKPAECIEDFALGGQMAYNLLYERYGSAFAHNLRLVLLPSPLFLKRPLSDAELVAAAASWQDMQHTYTESFERTVACVEAAVYG